MITNICLEGNSLRHMYKVKNHKQSHYQYASNQIMLHTIMWKSYDISFWPLQGYGTIWWNREKAEQSLNTTTKHSKNETQN